jgi:hypothetical protein
MSRAVKRFTALLASVVLLIVLLAAALYGFAPAIAKLVIAAALEDAALPPLDFRVDEITPRSIQLSQIRDQSGNLKVRGLEARWTLRQLREGRFDSLTVEGLFLQGRVEDGSLSIDALDAWLASPDPNEEPVAIAVCDRLVVRDAKLELTTPAGPQQLIANADLVLEPTLSGAISGTWRASTRATAALEVEVDGSGTLRGDLTLDSDREPIAPWLPELVTGLPAHLAGSIRAEAALGAPLSLDTTRPPRIAQGSAQLDFDASELAWGGEPISRATLSAEATLEGDRIGFETKTLRLERESGEPWELSLATTGHFESEAAVIEHFAVTLPSAPLVGREGVIDATGSARSEPERIEADLVLDAALDANAESGATRLRGPIQAQWTPEMLSLALPDCLEVDLGAGPLAAGLIVDEAARICVRTRGDSRIRVPLSPATELRIEAELALSADTLSLRSAAQRNPLRVRARALDAQLDVRSAPDGAFGTLALLADPLDLPRSGLHVRRAELEGSWKLADTSFDGRFRAGRLLDRQRPTRFSPLRGHVDFDATPTRIRFDGQARDETGSLRARIQGSHGIETGVGSADVRFEPLRFGDGRPTLAAIERWLGRTVRIETGTAEVRANVGWNPQTWRTRAEFSLADADLSASGSTVQGVEGKLTLADLSPATTEEPQELRFRSAEAGMPIGTGRVVYSLEAGRVVQIHESELELAGGRLQVSGTLDLAGGPNQRLDFAMVGVELPRLLKLVPVEGLSASGNLSGEMQLTVVDGRPVLRGGVIRAIEGGRIQYRPGGKVPPPASADDPTAVVRQVMSDFYYESMNVSVAGWLDESAAMQVQIRGYNPSFQDGHPINLTLNLSTAFAEAVAALPQIRELFEQLAESGTSGSPSPKRRP